VGHQAPLSAEAQHAWRLAICRWLGLFFEHLFEYPQP
jgi:hypothetical protein